MITYIIRRLLLIVPTFFGTTLLVFWILNITPDGPFDQEIKRIKQANVQSGEVSSGGMDDKPPGEIDEEVIKQLKREYGLDKPMLHRYLIWLGFAAKEIQYIAKHELNQPYKYTIRNLEEINNQNVPISLQKYIMPVMENSKLAIYESIEGTDFPLNGFFYIDDVNFDAIGFIEKIRIWEPYLYTVKNLGTEDSPILLQKYIVVDENLNIYESIECTSIEYENYKLIPKLEDLGNQEKSFWVESKWTVKKIDDYHVSLSLEDKDELLLEQDFKNHWTKSDWTAKKIKDSYLELSLQKHQGIFTGYLGESNQGESVSKLIWERLHISSFFGITGFILSYLVCIPLGIIKALRHGSKFDMASSGLVFIGYSIPAYAFGVLMIWIFSTTNFFAEPIFPSRGWRPENWEALSLWGKIVGQLKHAFLPTICYMLGSFATLTVLMKNSLMENMSQDYVRTAFAKGLTEKTVIFKHAVRNSLIPLATGIGGLIGVFLAGSYLIEKVFGIDGIGMLGFKSIQNRDFGIFLGFLVIGTVIRLIGNLISDICYAAIDPRIRFK